MSYTISYCIVVIILCTYTQTINVSQTCSITDTHLLADVLDNLIYIQDAPTPLRNLGSVCTFPPPPFMQCCPMVRGVSDPSNKKTWNRVQVCSVNIAGMGVGGGVKKLTLSFAKGGGYVNKIKKKMNHVPWQKFLCVDFSRTSIP